MLALFNQRVFVTDTIDYRDWQRLTAMRNFFSASCAIGLAVAHCVTGCVNHEAKPIDLSASSTALQARTLNDPQLRQRLLSLHLIDSGQMFPPAQWNRAQLWVAIALRNPEVAQAQQRLRLAVAGVTTARALPNPTVALGSEYSLSQTSESPWLWSISTDWLLDVGLRRSLRTQLADVQVRTARIEYAEALWSARSQLRSALLALLINEQRSRLLNQALSQQSQLVIKQQQRVKLGESSASEVLNANLELARLRTGVTEADAQHDTALAQLARLLGMPEAAIRSQQFAWNELFQVADINDAEMEPWREQALLTRGDLEKAILAYQSSELELQQAVRQQYPQWSIGPGYTWDHGVKKATLGVSFMLPVFNRNQGPIAEALAKRDLAGEQVLATQAQILNDIEASQAAYRSAVAVLQSQLEQSDAAESLLSQQQRALQLGGADRLDVVTADLALLTQQLAVLDQVERMRIALAQLEDALRRPLSGPELQLNATVLGSPEAQ